MVNRAGTRVQSRRSKLIYLMILRFVRCIIRRECTFPNGGSGSNYWRESGNCDETRSLDRRVLSADTRRAEASTFLAFSPVGSLSDWEKLTAGARVCGYVD